MFGIEKDFQNLMEQVYGPLNKDKMTEIEELKAQIKVLQSKLSFLEELEKTKSPVEEAFKDWMGVYPPTNPSVDNIFDIRWRAFQMGYNAAYEEKVAQEPEELKTEQRQKELVRESVKWCEEHPDKDPLDWVKPQTPEQVADGLKEAFREAVNKGVVSSVDKPKDDFMDKMVAELKGQNLTDLIYDWWEDVFTTHSDWDMETSIADLVDQIEQWLPKPQSAEGSQNAYVECTVEGFNDALNKIKRKLR